MEIAEKRFPIHPNVGAPRRSVRSNVFSTFQFNYLRHFSQPVRQLTKAVKKRPAELWKKRACDDIQLEPALSLNLRRRVDIRYFFREQEKNQTKSLEEVISVVLGQPVISASNVLTREKKN